MDAPTPRQQLIRSLFDDYIELYAARDERLLTRFSANFSGFCGSDATLVTDRDEWIAVMRRDFAQMPGRLGIEMEAITLQDLSTDCVAVTAFFHIHLPLREQILARETARLVTVFRREDEDWKIAHTSISIPYGQAGADEVYPMRSLRQRNRNLERLIEQRTRALAAANDSLQALSDTDALTGIGNRRHFDRMLRAEWERGQRTARPLALVMIDADRFKDFNDRYGHLAGDDCLRRLAAAIAACAKRPGDLAARYGGEEFVVLLPDTDEMGAIEIARRIQNEVWALAVAHAHQPAAIVTVSLGVASLVPSRFEGSDELLRLADAALYRAKQVGRNCLQTAV